MHGSNCDKVLGIVVQCYYSMIKFNGHLIILTHLHLKKTPQVETSSVLKSYFPILCERRFYKTYMTQKQHPVVEESVENFLKTPASSGNRISDVWLSRPISNCFSNKTNRNITAIFVMRKFLYRICGGNEFCICCPRVAVPLEYISWVMCHVFLKCWLPSMISSMLLMKYSVM